VAEPLEAFRNAFRIPELKSRILFTLLMLALYRLGAHIPTPGVDGLALAEKINRYGLGFMGIYDLFTGGAFANATVFALGIMPYITMSIIISLLIPVIPALEQLQKSGAEGQRKINDYTRYGTVGLCIFQSIVTGIYLQNQGLDIVPRPGIGFIILCVLSFTTGSAFIMWVGEQISERGVGNGISLLIFVSIVSRLPAAVSNLFSLIQTGQITVITAFLLIALMAAVVAGAILVTTGQRRIPVQYPRQVQGRRVSGGQRTYLPLRVNQAGVIPIIFASSILMLPSMLAGAVRVEWLAEILHALADPRAITHNVLYVILIIFFSYFYTAITFNPVEMADNMKKYGGIIVGVRPGKATAEYLNRVMTRVTLAGSVFLAAVALLPTAVVAFLRIEDWTIAQFFGGTSLLILVGVALDTIKQIEQHLIMRHYEGFAGKSGGRIRARRVF
jgi:preprotein translocase subunit SecY